MINPWRGLGSLPKAMWVLFAVTLTNRAGTMALPFLVLYLTQKLGYSPARAGLALTFYGVGAIVTSPLSGKLCDRIGAVLVMKATLILAGATLLFLPLTENFFVLCALVFVWAVFSEAFRPASLTIITDVVAPEHLKGAFALSRLAVNLGMSVGPVIAGFLTKISYTVIFLADGLTSILAGLLLMSSHLKISHQVPTDGEAQKTFETKPANRLNPWRDFRLLYFLLALIPVELVLFQTQAAMPIFVVNELGIDEAAYGALMSINTVMIIFIEVPFTLAIAHWSNRLALSTGSLLFAVGFGALALTSGGWGVGATVAVWTIGEMILFPGASAYMAEIAPKENRGSYMGLYLMTFSIAFAVAPWLGTAILGRFGSATLWVGTFVVGALSAAMMLFVRSKSAREKEEEKFAQARANVAQG